MIEVKHDPKIEFPVIEVPMLQEDEKNIKSDNKQTNIEGILVPLLRYNNYTITFDSVIRMKLRCGRVPTITVTFNDDTGTIKTLDTPGIDSMLYMQILPPFDNAYKKVQLGFRVISTKIRQSVVTVSGTYYVPNLFDNVMKPYGFISTYELFEKVSNEYGLGFCSNISGSEDERYIYNPNKKPIEFLDDEIIFSGKDEHVFDWWIDLWNNINLVDIYDAYREIIPDEDLRIWVSDTLTTNMSPDFTAEPISQVAAFCNHPMFSTTDLYVREYTPKVAAGGSTDMNYEVYILNDLESKATEIRDDDIEYNKTAAYVYGGEVFGDFDYLTQKAAREMFVRKINGQTIEVETYRPLLGLMKGGHVNFWWFDTDNIVIDDLDTSEIESNIPLPDDIKMGDSSYKINRSVSGQYYICNIDYEYRSGEWTAKYTLSRPADKINRKNAPDKETFMD